MLLHSSLVWKSVHLLKERDGSVSFTFLKHACLTFRFLWGVFWARVCVFQTVSSITSIGWLSWADRLF